MYQIAVKYDAMEETPLRYRRKAHSGERVAEAPIYLNSRDLTVWQNRPEFRDASRRCTLVHASVPNRRLGRSTAQFMKRNDVSGILAKERLGLLGQSEAALNDLPVSGP